MVALFAALALMAAAAPAPARPQHHAVAADTVATPAEKAYFAQVKQAIARRDVAWLARECVPTLVLINGHWVHIATARQFAANYDAIFNRRVTAAVLSADPRSLGRTWRGVMIGQRGEMWITTRLDEKTGRPRVMIAAINNGDPDRPSPPQPVLGPHGPDLAPIGPAISFAEITGRWRVEHVTPDVVDIGPLSSEDRTYMGAVISITAKAIGPVNAKAAARFKGFCEEPRITPLPKPASAYHRGDRGELPPVSGLRQARAAAVSCLIRPYDDATRTYGPLRRDPASEVVRLPNGRLGLNVEGGLVILVREP